ncbi:MAG: DUF1768 domain-containing protein [Lachnospiraceae bacterium]|nr:DUF1768 domain-containing protein [Lachnospiraceae bacterium]
MMRPEEQTAAESMDGRIVVCLSRDRSAFSYVTWLADGGGFTHASLGLSEEADHYYSFNFKGLKKEYRTSLKRRPREMMRYVIAVPEDAHRRLEEIVAEMEREKDRYQYAKLGVSLRLMNLPTVDEDDDKYYCSEFVAAVLKESGCVDIRTPSYECTPNDLLRELEASGQICAVEEESEMENPGEAAIGLAMEGIGKGRDLADRYVDERLGDVLDRALDKIEAAKERVGDAPEGLAHLTGGLLRKATRRLHDDEENRRVSPGHRRTVMDMERGSNDSGITYFWHEYDERGFLSNWYEAPFIEGDFCYSCVEQYMMSKKAVLFHDAVTNTKILRADTALECRDLGREIRPFDPAVWDAEKIGIVTQGNRLKYTQHPELLEQLLATGDTYIAEANPTEKIWGIGVDRETAETMPRSAWPGTNLQGELLMRLREELRNGTR